ncbi:MAG: S8 family serine peptidase [Asgard group archaeon]|nr:S8 family serine peptidase [Asgard group archaeon]
MKRRKIVFIASNMLLLFSLSLFNSNNTILELGLAQNFENSYHHNLIGSQGAWAITNGTKDITVAVIDSGIDFFHSELQNVAWINENEISNNSIDDDGNGYVDDIRGWDFVNDDNNPGPETGDLINRHGTFITGLIAAPLNGKGPVGIAQNVSIMDVRVLSSDNYLGVSYLGFGDAIRYAVDNGADVLSISIHNMSPDDIYHDDILYAVENNVVVVAITGNTDDGGLEFRTYPGGYDEVIAVGASTANNLKASYSNYGLPWTEIVAPVGNRLDSTTLDNTYGWGWGTSYACPQVAAVVALMKSLNNSLSVSEIRNILRKSATDIGDPGKDIYFGYGLLNATKAVMAVLDPSVLEVETDKTNTSFIYYTTAVIILAGFVVIRKKRKKTKM